VVIQGGEKAGGIFHPQELETFLLVPQQPAVVW
jgi:hypothetical protein